MECARGRSWPRKEEAEKMYKLNLYRKHHLKLFVCKWRETQINKPRRRKGSGLERWKETGKRKTGRRWIRMNRKNIKKRRKWERKRGNCWKRKTRKKLEKRKTRTGKNKLKTEEEKKETKEHGEKEIKILKK